MHLRRPFIKICYLLFYFIGIIFKNNQIISKVKVLILKVTSILESLHNFPANAPPVFHVQTAWKRLFPSRFNVEYTWCVCTVMLVMNAKRVIIGKNNYEVT